MPVQVKICGLTSPAAVAAAAAADFAGFVFFPRSPRHLSPEAAADLAAKLPRRVQRVAVMVDPDDALLRATLARFRPDLLQLHGAETPERVAAIRHGFSLKIVKAVPIRTASDVAAAHRYEGVADWLMFDAKPSPGALPGGNATRFDWALLAGRTWAVPWFLSGGLDAQNIGSAIRGTGPAAVDVSSGVEDRPGHKVPRLIAEFIGTARAAAPSTGTAADRLR